MTDGRVNWKVLASKAREESAPVLNVAPLVVQRIARSSTLPVSAWSLTELLVTGLSVAAAMLMMLTVASSGISWDDPFGDWLSSLVLVMS